MNYYTKQMRLKRNSYYAKKYLSDAVKEKLSQIINSYVKSETGGYLEALTPEQISEINDNNRLNKEIIPEFRNKKNSEAANNHITGVANENHAKEAGLTSVAYLSEDNQGKKIPKWKHLLNPKKYQKGEKITFEVVTDESEVIDENNGTWGQLKSLLISDQDKIGRTPIKILSDGKLIGYVHDINWKPRHNVTDEQLAKEQSALYTLRQAILNNGLKGVS